MSSWFVKSVQEVSDLRLTETAASLTANTLAASSTTSTNPLFSTHRQHNQFKIRAKITTITSSNVRIHTFKIKALFSPPL